MPRISDNACAEWLTQRGVTDFPESRTTGPRLEALLAFARGRNGKCSAEEARSLIAECDESDPGSIHNSGTAYLTYANPRAEPGRFWVMQPNDGPGAEWETLAIQPGLLKAPAL
ncbi:MAG: hypothetical protein Q7T82_19955 [Armatimonadota bacterium]|nr:hypothetical protein [Armatimonadota bacterium]